MRRLISILLLVMVIPATAQEAVYRWTDGQGRTHYGNRPPADAKAEPVDLNPQPVTVTAGKEVYTWTDEEGHTHYGDRPSTVISAEKVDMDAIPLSTIRATEFRLGEQDLLRQLEQQNR
jgi:hypothetical protein